MFRVPNHHIAKYLAQYVGDVLGVENVVLPKAPSTKALGHAPKDMTQNAQNLVTHSRVALWVVVAEAISETQRDLLNKMLAAIDSPTYQLVNDFGVAGRPVLVLVGSSATIQDAGVFATHSLADLLEGRPEEIRQRKSEAWQILKELKRYLGERK